MNPFAAAVLCAAIAMPLAAQQDVPAVSTQEPAAPAPNAAPIFPKVDPANFTAAAPTKETVDAFFNANWGYDTSRIWEVAAVLKTHVEGLSKVVVYVGDKTGKQKPQALVFYVLPDGQNMIIGDQLIPFGAKPFANNRAILQQRADGPYRGSDSKDFELVEFADFQCPHCKAAQETMDKLVADYPNARVVYQSFPLEKIHPESFHAAAVGYCVAKMGGNKAFFTYAAAVFEGQEGLASPDSATLTLNSAVSKAGLDPAKAGECANLPATKAAVEAGSKLATDLEVNETPLLMINGRAVPATVPYDQLKIIIDFQLKMDGLSAK